MLLDDVLSAVDRISRMAILKGLLDRDTGLLRQSGSAVVFATNHGKWPPFWSSGNRS